MFKLRADKLQRNFQITSHKLISFLASSCQQLGPRGLFCDGFLQLVPVERGCWHQTMIVARWSALSTLIYRRGRKMSLTTESNVLPVWPLKCTRQHSSMLTLNVNVQPLLLLALKVTSAAYYRNCSDRIDGILGDRGHSSMITTPHKLILTTSLSECCNWLHVRLGFTIVRVKSCSSYVPWEIPVIVV